MNLGPFRRLAALVAALIPAAVSAQENSAKRLSSIVSVAVEEYGKAFDTTGRLVSELEYNETTSFLADAKIVAKRLRGYNAISTQALLDTLSAAVTENGRRAKSGSSRRGSTARSAPRGRSTSPPGHSIRRAVMRSTPRTAPHATVTADWVTARPREDSALRSPRSDPCPALPT